jgi:hypothetical protein
MIAHELYIPKSKEKMQDNTETEGKHLAVIIVTPKSSKAWWYSPIIPATWQAEIRRIAVQGQPMQKS